MITEEQAHRTIHSARRAAESGRELAPETIQALECIAESVLPESIRLEAEILIGLEAMS